MALSRKLKEEATELADKKVAEEISAEISSLWIFNNPPPPKPVLLSLGGFQGSGKTTVLKLLKSRVDLAIVSADEIKYKLFQRGWKFNEIFRQTVNAARDVLLLKALLTGHNVAIDQFVTKERVKVAFDILKKSKKNYRSVFVYLDAPKDILIDRVKNRKPFPGIYNGTIEELKADFQKRGHPDYEVFDKIFDSSKETPRQLTERVKTLLMS